MYTPHQLTKHLDETHKSILLRKLTTYDPFIGKKHGVSDYKTLRALSEADDGHKYDVTRGDMIRRKKSEGVHLMKKEKTLRAGARRPE